jgi:hypothetical protein
MWGNQNNARNILVRPLPEDVAGDLELSATPENRPFNQYEQVDLVWYYNDSNMVKLELELVDSELCVLMGREEQDCRCAAEGKPAVYGNNSDTV